MNFKNLLSGATVTGALIFAGFIASELKAELMQEKPKTGSQEAKPAPKDPKAATVAAADEKAVNPLLSPHSPEMTSEAPASFKVEFETSKGKFVVKATRSLSPNGADRFYNLVRHGFYNDCRFFRVIKGFMVQFGVNGDPMVSQFWRTATIDDDPVKSSNKRGTITFAKTGAPNSRTTQLFINYANNSNLDGMGFAPFGEVIEGMDVVDALNGNYGEGAPRGKGPDQGRIQMEGNTYLKAAYADLDYIKKASIIK
jgi:peptidyl-prolyl cis-trans isomerase A (cyclophilin A)